MKVLMINGSPRENGNTATALKEMQKIFDSEGIETELVCIGKKDIRGCIGCMTCRRAGKCAFNDIVNELASSFAQADGVVVGSPVYYGSPNGSLIALLDRLFFSTKSMDKRMKVGAGVLAARRSGLTASFDVLNKYFTVSGMPLAPSRYWNDIHGADPGEAEQDAEGLQTMRILARNMVFMMRSFALGREKYGLPEQEERQITSFIR